MKIVGLITTSDTTNRPKIRSLPSLLVVAREAVMAKVGQVEREMGKIPRNRQMHLAGEEEDRP